MTFIILFAVVYHQMKEAVGMRDNIQASNNTCLSPNGNESQKERKTRTKTTDKNCTLSTNKLCVCVPSENNIYPNLMPTKCVVHYGVRYE